MPYTGLVHRVSLLGGVAEATWNAGGTITAPLASTTILDADMQPDDFFANGRREPGAVALGTIKPVPSRTTATLTFRQHLATGDAFTTLLPCAGYELSVATYIPVTTFTNAKRPTMAFKLWEGGILKAMTGAAGTCTIDLQAGAPAVANWTWHGNWSAVTDVAAPAFTSITAMPWTCQGMTLTIAGAAVPLTGRMTIDLGNDIVARDSLAAATGVLHYFVAKRAPKITMSMEAQIVNDLDVHGFMLAQTNKAIVATLTNGVNTLTASAPTCTITDIKRGERGGLATFETTLECNINAGNDELTFAVT